jgi:hypothetical protein
MPQALLRCQAKTELVASQLTQRIKDTRGETEVTREQIKLTREELAGVGNSQGAVAEEFFVNSLNDMPQIGKLKFDQVLPNLTADKGSDRAQFDVVLVNGKCVAIVEVKYKVQAKTLLQVESQVIEFRKRFPVYENYKIYAGVAGFSIPPALVEMAHEKGLFVLKRTGTAFAVDAVGMKAF